MCSGKQKDSLHNGQDTKSIKTHLYSAKCHKRIRGARRQGGSQGLGRVFTVSIIK